MSPLLRDAASSPPRRDPAAIEPHAHARPSLGPWRAGALVAGNMIGSGVFLLPASLAAYGAFSIAGWIVSTFGALVLALVFSTLGREIPRVGGPYAYAREALGELPGFLVAWGYWISICAGNAAIAIAFAGYAGHFAPSAASDPRFAPAVALSAVWLLTAVNARGVREAGILQLVTTCLKILPLLAVGLWGLRAFRPEHLVASLPEGISGPSAVLGAAVLTLWAFLGLESATIPAEDVIRPRRTIPLATVAGTLCAALLYFLSTTAVQGLVPPRELATSAEPFGDAALRLWGPAASAWVAAGAAVACFGALNGWVLLQGQMPLAAARDGLFPAAFARVSRRGTPGVGLVVSSLLVTLVVLTNYTRGLVGAFTFVILLSTLTCLLPYLLSCLALLRSGPPGGRRLGERLLGASGLLFSGAAIAAAGWETWIWGLVLLLAGLPVFISLRAKSS